MSAPTGRQRALLARQRAAAQAIAAESTFHQARVLLLINAFSGRTRGVKGLAKLVRLDYVLRFPHLLPLLPLPQPLDWPDTAALTSAEQVAAGDGLASGRYGLWYDRYTLLLGSLAGKLLITIGPGRIVEPIVTAEGRQASRALAEIDDWRSVAARAAFLKSVLDLSGDQLDRLFRATLTRQPVNAINPAPGQ